MNIPAKSRAVGLHIRVPDSLFFVLEKAQRLSLDLFQCFLLSEITQQFFILDAQDTALFFQQHTANYAQRYMHASYLINLADTRRMLHPLLVHEINFGKKYGFTHMILHAGFTKGANNKIAGIDAVARALNGAMRYENNISFVLENTAFGALAVGSDLNDFAVLLSKLDKPDQISFCLDTAHAHAYGYDIKSKPGLEQFISLVDDTMGIDKLQLIHLNDTFEKCGAHADRHHMTGEGEIGWDALQAFAMHPRLAHLPLIMELPPVSEEKEWEIVEKVRSWST